MAQYTITLASVRATTTTTRARCDAAFLRAYAMAYDCLKGVAMLDTQAAWRVYGTIRQWDDLPIGNTVACYVTDGWTVTVTRDS